MIRLQIMLCSFLFLHASDALAGATVAFETANDVYFVCGPSSIPTNPACTAYIAGTVDTLRYLQSMGDTKLHCIPNDVTIGQIVELTRAYFDAHSQALGFSAPSVIEDAMKTAFPCKT